MLSIYSLIFILFIIYVFFYFHLKFITNLKTVCSTKGTQIYLPYPQEAKKKSNLHMKRQVGKRQTNAASRTNSYMLYSAGQEGDLKL